MCKTELMTKLEITLEIVLNSLMLSFIAAMVRVMFSKLTCFQDTLKIFIGSILFGVIVGYVSNDFEGIKPYIKILVVVASIFGKELYLWSEKIFSDPSKNIGLFLKVFNAIKGININFNNKTPKDNDVT